MAKKNIEIESALRAIKLLKKFKSAKTQKDKDDLVKQLQDTNLGAYDLITKHNYDPTQLAIDIQKALKLNDFRPKNMSIINLASSYDLDSINGEFDTFDLDISKMVKNNEDPKKIREKFIAATANISILAKQFSTDWIRRLKNHKNLVKAAYNANDENIVDAYNKLFDALTKDFCKEYGCSIDSKVITDWATSDIKPKKGWDKTNAYQQQAHGLTIPNNISKEEKTKIIEKFKKNPTKYPGSYRTSIVRVNITNIKKRHPEPIDFFCTMICGLVHEIHHALDYQKPHESALGSQIEYVDSKTYIHPSEDLEAYLNSATEISSHKIQHELFNQLKNIQF